MTQKAALRIIDANFNRAREALRVVEEYCRFALNNAHLSTRTKQIRHDLTHALTALDLEGLVTCRDTAGDVGTAYMIADPQERSDLEDCLRAGCKRLTEALRTLSEMIQIEDPRLAKVLEALRYQSYTLEKDIILLGIPSQGF
ncbi:MAG: thiamine phosphate synthase, partial [Planctomycetes bacterium]|nr:thiamine phosphate synthase [Planctomycetota bacterium]